ncbi:MAG: hypothetical protein M1834_005416 [Cirrosporium novae-zelandiae]|nr:MAG: hypothetical protein M1834_005416 [Cirrosporium novae-zelandiae]
MPPSRSMQSSNLRASRPMPPISLPPPRLYFEGPRLKSFDPYPSSPRHNNQQRREHNSRGSERDNARKRGHSEMEEGNHINTGPRPSQHARIEVIDLSSDDEEPHVVPPRRLFQQLPPVTYIDLTEDSDEDLAPQPSINTNRRTRVRIMRNNMSRSETLHDLMHLPPPTLKTFTALRKDCFDEDANKRECNICLDNFETGQELGRLSCGRLCVWHADCIKKWSITTGGKMSCPLHRDSQG